MLRFMGNMISVKANKTVQSGIEALVKSTALETAPLGATDLARVLDGAGVTSALLPDPHPQAAAMAHLPGWHPAGREGDWTLFARGEPRD